MKIDIWMDVRCPFCYIGKKNFELALSDFKYKDNLTLIWHTFDNEPGFENPSQIKAFDNFFYAFASGKEFGFDFNFKNLIPANSFNAHRLIQFARSEGVGAEAFESLFQIHFSEGKNIDDLDTLVAIGISLGMKKEKLKEVLKSDAFSAEVRQDETKAKNLGITEAPFFILDRKLAISGDQSPEAYLNALNEGWGNFKKHKPFIFTGGESFYSIERKN